MTRKHIYIFSPSGAVRDKTAFRRGVKRLSKLGYEVEIDRDALSTYQRFAGDDSTRLGALHRAAESGADVALISRGGYGLTRLLPDIQYKKIAKAIARGTQFVGISDFTAFQMAVLAKTGGVSWAGPGLCEGFGALPVPDDIMEDCFQDLMQERGEGTGWKTGPTSSVQKFIAKNAVLWGGNLAMLTSLIGTPYMPAIKGGILFLEDVGEHPYKIERMLTQLWCSGILKNQKAILLGQFTGYQSVTHDRGFKLASVVSWLQSKVTTPIFTNLPYGHVQTKVLLPVGAEVELWVEDRNAMLVWGDLK